MKTSRLAAMLGILLLSVAAAVPASETGYVCPPCSCGLDDEVHAEAGTCPACGMQLVEKGTVEAPRDRLDVAILIFDGVQIIDYTGPYEVFGQAGFNVFTVGATNEPILTTMGMEVRPKYRFGEHPDADLLVIPGGVVDGQYAPEVIAWVKRSAARAEHVLSVCNGAFILAKAGLLDGLRATTFYGLIDALRQFAPEVEVVSDQRFVDNGKIVTSAGLSSGIDASLHLVSRIHGEVQAKRLALHLEYEWNPGSTYARAALADLLLPDVEMPDGSDVQILATEGGRDRWEVRYRVEVDMTAPQLMAHLSRQLDRREKWSRAGGKELAGRWRFEDASGASWESEGWIEPDPEAESRFVVGMKIRRSGDPAGK